jgi:hypothetical protein
MESSSGRFVKEKEHADQTAGAASRQRSPFTDQAFERLVCARSGGPVQVRAAAEEDRRSAPTGPPKPRAGEPLLRVLLNLRETRDIAPRRSLEAEELFVGARRLVALADLLERDARSEQGERRVGRAREDLRERIERRHVLALPREREAERGRGLEIVAQLDRRAQRALGVGAPVRGQERLTQRSQGLRALRLELHGALEVGNAVGQVLEADKRVSKEEVGVVIVPRREGGVEVPDGLIRVPLREGDPSEARGGRSRDQASP